MTAYRNNLGRFTTRRNQFVGSSLTLVSLPIWPVHAIISGLKTVHVLQENPGVTFENFRKLGGSTSRLRRMVKKGFAVAA